MTLLTPKLPKFASTWFIAKFGKWYTTNVIANYCRVCL